MFYTVLFWFVYEMFLSRHYDWNWKWNMRPLLAVIDRWQGQLNVRPTCFFFLFLFSLVSLCTIASLFSSLRVGVACMVYCLLFSLCFHFLGNNSSSYSCSFWTFRFETHEFLHWTVFCLLFYFKLFFYTELFRFSLFVWCLLFLRQQFKLIFVFFFKQKQFILFFLRVHFFWKWHGTYSNYDGVRNKYFATYRIGNYPTLWHNICRKPCRSRSTLRVWERHSWRKGIG